MRLYDSEGCDFCKYGSSGSGREQDHVEHVREQLVVEGFVDNGFWGDSDIYVASEYGDYTKYDPDTPDLDLVFKALEGERVRVTIERLPPAERRSDASVA